MRAFRSAFLLCVACQFVAGATDALDTRLMWSPGAPPTTFAQLQYAYYMDAQPPLRLTRDPPADRAFSDPLPHPVFGAPSTWGPFEPSTTSLAGVCFLYVLQPVSPGATEYTELGPVKLPPNDAPRGTRYQWLCIESDASPVLTVGGTSAATRALTYTGDILPTLHAGVPFGRRRAFSRTVCVGLNVEWLAQTNADSAATATDPGAQKRWTYVNKPEFACRETTFGFRTSGLPRTPVTPGVADAIVNPTIEYYCVNSTRVWDEGQTIGAFEYAPDTRQYALECWARDPFADAYQDAAGYLLPGKTLPNALTCSATRGIESQSKMTETCAFGVYVSPDGATHSTRQTEFRCTYQCRYPCVTYAAAPTLARHPIRSECAPTSRELQCTQDVTRAAAAYCGPQETLSAHTLDLDTVYDAFSRDVYSACVVGTLECQLRCFCPSEHGCAQHPKCNYHGTLFESSVPSVRPHCQCNSQYMGATCQNSKVDSAVCNRGQEL
jgi:hypothetical protein